MRKIRLFTILAFAAFALSNMSFNYENPTGKAGACGGPNEGGTCSKSGCHTGFTDNSQGGSVTITSSNMTNWTYVPGQVYSLTVTVAESGISTWGFALEALKSNGDNGGTVAAGSGSHILTSTIGGFSRKYCTQSTEGSGNNTKSWTFNWTAPSTDVGAITLYAVGMAANGNGGKSGDHVYKTTQVLNAAVGITENKANDLSIALYPNPTTDLLNVDYSLENAGRTRATVMTTDGRLVKVLFDANSPAGSIHKTMDVSDLAAGTYLLNLVVDGQAQEAKMFEKH